MKYTPGSFSTKTQPLASQTGLKDTTPNNNEGKSEDVAPLDSNRALSTKETRGDGGSAENLDTQESQRSLG